MPKTKPFVPHMERWTKEVYRRYMRFYMQAYRAVRSGRACLLKGFADAIKDGTTG